MVSSRSDTNDEYDISGYFWSGKEPGVCLYYMERQEVYKSNQTWWDIWLEKVYYGLQ